MYMLCCFTLVINTNKKIGENIVIRQNQLKIILMNTNNDSTYFAINRLYFNSNEM